jgi:hypothetical protein
MQRTLEPQLLFQDTIHQLRVLARLGLVYFVVGAPRMRDQPCFRRLTIE